MLKGIENSHKFNKLALGLGLMLALLWQGGQAKAADSSKASLLLGGGVTEVFDNDNHAAELHVQYLFGDHLLNTIRPFLGVMATTDATIYGYGGLRFEFNLGNDWQVVPNFAIGAYHAGDGKDLGGTMEFRDGIEINYDLPVLGRIGLEFYHMSNASIYDKNPGTEVITLNYIQPIAW